MNSNLVHNVINVVIALIAAATAFLVATGCSTSLEGVIDCSKSWISPEYTTIAIAALAFLKTCINIVRDGLKGLFKEQPPVQ